MYTCKYACIDLQEPHKIQFGQKHQVNQREDTPKCDTKGCPNYVKIQINTWSEISKGVKSNNTWSIRHQLKKRYQLGEKIPRRG